MGKYSNKIVNDYINGYEIENIDELENNCSFMMKAINLSGDYKLYNLCSDNLKKDYKFVSFLINKFTNNIDFICRVADYYLNNVDDELTRVELLTTMIELTKNHKEKNLKYRLYGHSIYCYKRVQIEAAKKRKEYESIADELDMGFIVVYEDYNYNKKVLNFFATKFIDGIFDEYDIDLECMIHDEYDDKDKLIEKGLNNYMINFICDYDMMLANYLSIHKDLLDNFRNRIVKVINNWDRYNAKVEHDKYYLMFDKVHEYISNNDMLLDETTILYFLGIKLGVAETILKYDTLYGCSLKEVLEDIDLDYVRECLEHSFEERIHLRNIKQIMIETLLSKNDREIIDNSKVIKLDFKQGRNK